MSTDDDSDAASSETWLDRSGPLLYVHGYAEAAQLLNDPRLHVDYQRLFVAEGPAQERLTAAGRRSLLNLNGEEHKRLRSEIASNFRPRAADRIRSFARQTAERLLSEMPVAEPFDFMQRFAKPYIELTTAEYVGFPPADLDALNNALALMANSAGDLRNRSSEFNEGCAALLDYATEALLSRLDHPTDDVLGRLAQLTKSGAIDELFAASLIGTLLSAGLEPATLQLGILVEEFSKLPNVWNSVTADDDHVAQVLEELLRFRSANPGALRWLQTDITQQGVHFDKGSSLIVDLVGANHDSRRYARPDAFDPDANQGSHLAFGFGPHHCLGAPLVRAQLQEALRVMANNLHCPTVISVETKADQGTTGPLKLIVKINRRDQL